MLQILFCTAAVIGFVLFMYRERIAQAVREMGSENWRDGEGTVESLDVKEEDNRNGAYYRLDVAYSYQLAGEYYSGHHLSVAYNTREEVDEISATLPVGSKVPIKIHPQDPSRSAFLL